MAHQTGHNDFCTSWLIHVPLRCWLGSQRINYGRRCSQPVDVSNSWKVTQKLSAVWPPLTPALSPTESDHQQTELPPFNCKRLCGTYSGPTLGPTPVHHPLFLNICPSGSDWKFNLWIAFLWQRKSLFRFQSVPSLFYFYPPTSKTTACVAWGLRQMTGELE